MGRATARRFVRSFRIAAACVLVAVTFVLAARAFGSEAGRRAAGLVLLGGAAVFVLSDTTMRGRGGR